jgi:hypothetical protein
MSILPQQNRSKANLYLEEYIFYDLKNINDGFDAETIQYFSETDFEKVLKRCKKHNLGIYGIEPWLDGEFYDVITFEQVSRSPDSSDWYFKAFEKFKAESLELQYSATYSIPDNLLE